MLLEESGDGEVRPVWLGTAERSYEFITSTELFRAPGADIFSAMYCLNGTGGCEQKLLVFLEDEVRAVERDSTWQYIFAHLPVGYKPHKSPPIDLETLTWEHHVAGPCDTNCCPSGRLFLVLTLEGHVLGIKSARLEVDLHVPDKD